MVGVASPALADFPLTWTYEQQAEVCQLHGGKVVNDGGYFRCQGGDYSGTLLHQEFFPDGTSWGEREKLCRQGGGEVMVLPLGGVHGTEHQCDGGKYSGATIGVD
ncbi:hypothetical protein ABT337_23330 [Saccharopolyspora hirsuta]|uniref:hypothetical protein n=1 Tax=Saccharopolyspora hirsuta TaxID=1837 RepID=UPI003318E979